MRGSVPGPRLSLRLPRDGWHGPWIGAHRVGEGHSTEPVGHA